jgi:dTDP-4-dehydrorhamnose 3,5-epimerase
MKALQIRSLAIPDVKTVRFGRYRDDRGYFAESFRRSDLKGYGEDRCFEGVDFLQANESYSRADVVRGLHFQWNPRIGKLVRTLAGRMVDLVLDIRKGSPYFGKIIAHDMPARIDSEYDEWIWVPPGFAHGNFFQEPTRIEYFCSGEYSPGCEAGISPFAGDLDWSLCDPSLKGEFDKTAVSPILSPKDSEGMTLSAWLSDMRSAHFVFGQC